MKISYPFQVVTKKHHSHESCLVLGCTEFLHAWQFQPFLDFLKMATYMLILPIITLFRIFHWPFQFQQCVKDVSISLNKNIICYLNSTADAGNIVDIRAYLIPNSELEFPLSHISNVKPYLLNEHSLYYTSTFVKFILPYKMLPEVHNFLLYFYTDLSFIRAVSQVTICSELWIGSWGAY